MITVKEAVSLLKDSKKIYIAWAGCTTQLDTRCTLMMDAYGKYLVSEINQGNENNTFELQIASRPMAQE